ncbi:MAG: transcription termination factor Rho [Planctomycetes bacterium]|nr:transcription termination factor Rho [Planctomycetota bacterium]
MSRPPAPTTDPDESAARRVADLGDDERNAVYERAKRTDYDIPRLQALSIGELLQIATEADVESTVGLSRQELIFQILKRKVTAQGLGWGEGTLDILPDGFGFLRSRRYNYQAGPDDIYVSPSQIRRLNLKQGHQIAGPVRPPKDGEKYFALLHIEWVDGKTVDDLRRRIAFDDLTPVLPDRRLVLDLGKAPLDVRVVDLLAPLGFGQRTLVLAPPNSRRNALLTHLAQAILDGNPTVYVILLLLDERPEEVTIAQRSTAPDDRREVVASTFDEPAARHVALAEMALMKCKRMVESGRDVVLCVDSLTSLVRAYNLELPPTGKTLCAGLDAAALQQPKRLFGAARNVEEGGSLTVLATALTGTGARIDEVIAEEFRGKGNCEIVLDERLAGLHLYPPIDVLRTGTRREDSLLPPQDLLRLRALRAAIDRTSARESLEMLIARVEATTSNRALLDAL